LITIKNKWYYWISALAIFAIILFEAQGKGDFYIFISASRDLLSQKNIYQIKYLEWYNYYYSVLFALILIPFTYLPLYFTKVLWLMANVYFVYRIWQILLTWLPIQNWDDKKRLVFSLLSFLFISRFIRDNFHLAQMTIFILYLSLEGLSLILKNKFFIGSLLLAFGTDIKLLPIVLIPYLIYRSEWKGALYTIGIIVVLLFIPSIFIGYDYNWFLLKERWGLINPVNTAHILDTEEISFHSLTTLLATLLIENPGDKFALTLKRNIANVSIEELNIIINLVRLFFIVLSLYFFRTRPFKNNISQIQRLYEISYLCLIIPLIFPHQQFYAFFFMFPASTYLLFYLINYYFEDKNLDNHFTLKKTVIITGLILSYLLTNCHFILGEFNAYYNHYKVLTYGALLMVVLLALLPPRAKILCSP
jgi:hypothetical protein